jgi:hypothetical protein
VGLPSKAGLRTRFEVTNALDPIIVPPPTAATRSLLFCYSRVGTATASLVHPATVFRGAILRQTTAIIIGHTHPGGDVSPGAEDDQITKRLVQVGELVGIRVVDRVIVNGEGRFYRYSTENRI